ncbi:MAG: lytic transglycosylase domain-containing protein [Bacteroidales bacterium]|nr:MAG: lytic transglycosylase domain-containing protein [Bacteroidales bacterium]
MKFENNWWKRFTVIGAVLSFSLIIFLYITLTADIAGCSELSRVKYISRDTAIFRNPAYQITLPDSLSFANEDVPLKYFDVRESLDRELQLNTYWHSQTLLLLKRANRFFPIIEPILKEKGIPDDFKYLAVAESALAQEISPAKAVGFWQILETTGKELGLEINKEVDERYNIVKSTRVACDFLQRSYNKFGSWTIAAATYNFGRNGIDRQIGRQNNESYYNLVLGEETGRYLFRILAFKVIMENPQEYGFVLSKKNLYPPLKYTYVEVDTPITNIARFAEHFNTNYKMLKTFNPWLRDVYLPNKTRKKYMIQIPEAGFREKAYNE